MYLHPDSVTPSPWSQNTRLCYSVGLSLLLANLSSPTKPTSMISPTITGKNLNSPPKVLSPVRGQHMQQPWSVTCKWLSMEELPPELKTCWEINSISLISEDNHTGRLLIPDKIREPPQGKDMVTQWSSILPTSSYSEAIPATKPKMMYGSSTLVEDHSPGKNTNSKTQGCHARGSIIQQLSAKKEKLKGWWLSMVAEDKRKKIKIIVQPETPISPSMTSGD